ncbi:MAG: glycosyltransferase [Steroidobacteraceae bacterium]
MRPAVSIVMPVFDRLKYLGETVDSIFDQSFLDWELLIADDGSGAETQAYLRTIEDGSRVKVIRLSHSGNPAAVRNAALNRACGEYVAFIDSDDVWMKDKLHTQIASLRAQIGLEWGYTAFTLMDDAGNLLRGPRAGRCPTAHARILDRLVREEALVVTPSVVVRRDLIARVGGYNENLLVCEDYDLWLRLASCGEADFIERPLVRVRRHAEHSFDDVSCLENLRRVVESAQRSAAAAHLAPVLGKRRADISVTLARRHAANRHGLRVLVTLWSSASYSWRYGRWWTGGLAAIIRALAPEGALRALRRYRHAGKAAAALRATPR